MEEKRIHIVDIGELVQDDHNFNRGTEDGAKLMERSFEELGAGRSVLVDKDNRLIAGNKSTETARKKGIKRVIIVDTEGDELVAVRRKDVTLDSKMGRELALADNATTQVNLAWNEIELHNIAEQYGIDIDEWGVDLPDTAGIEEKDTEEDDFDEQTDTVDAVCKAGDVWRLGNHRLMCGDSTKEEDIRRLMQGEEADLWLTDPPYNVAVENSQGITIQNDNMESSEFRSFLTAAFSATKKVLRNGCPFYVWFASCEHTSFESALNNAGLKVRQELIWNKNHFTLGRSHYQWKHKPCLYGWNGDTCRYFINVRNRCTVLEDETELNFDKMTKAEMLDLLKRIYEQRVPTTIINEKKPTKDSEHPTMKPVRLFGLQITNSSQQGDIVLDTFGGSGTTAIACEQLDRRARIMELDPHFCDVIIARWEKFTGRKAEKVK